MTMWPLAKPKRAAIVKGAMMVTIVSVDISCDICVNLLISFLSRMLLLGVSEARVSG